MLLPALTAQGRCHDLVPYGRFLNGLYLRFCVPQNGINHEICEDWANLAGGGVYVSNNTMPYIVNDEHRCAASPPQNARIVCMYM